MPCGRPKNETGCSAVNFSEEVLALYRHLYRFDTETPVIKGKLNLDKTTDTAQKQKPGTPDTIKTTLSPPRAA